MSAVLPNRTLNQLNHSGKIKAKHLNRKAIIYIRQSTLQQVQRKRPLNHAIDFSKEAVQA
jgi:hypothetical protein